ncbi:uncharacterized protein LOC132937079 [Metopolophium dirhodum]|uniref:uncharacterized protein LOC132937079 n=1 Tax=Metopolophium dirhodum TaxID=44670 RepID=UPI00298F6731|nr:uncharacterized protein LOC132937079 [Metopolophium dirhodum]
MNSIVVATICAMFITFSEADIKEGSLPSITAHIPLLENIRDACMLMGKANYSVSSMRLDSPQIGGCVHFNQKKTDVFTTKSFTLWLDTLQNGKQQCGQEGMEQIRYSCEEFSKTSIGNTDDGAKFVRLYGRDVNKKGVESIRCALFEKDVINSTIFRLAVSGNNSCFGLAKVFDDKLSTIPEGSNFLRLTRDPEYQEHQSRDKRSAVNPTPTVQNQDWFTVWMLG